MRGVNRGLAAAAIAALALTVLTACGRQATTSAHQRGSCGPSGALTSVVVTRLPSKAGPPGGIPKSQVESRNATQARRLYGTACRLAAVHAQFTPGAAVSCPADFGLVYDIVFFDRGARLATASYHASGCQTLSMVSASGPRLSTVILGKRAPALAKPFDAALVAILGGPISPLHG